nr:hypothetical protein AXF42_Ash005074 [Ipomoea batatas]
MPRVFNPGRLLTFTGETADPSGFDMFPGLLRPWKRKSSALTSIGYIPAALESLTATQKSCKGLGSDACANEDANAKMAMETIIRTSGLIGGSEPNTALAMVMTPGFWLLKPAKAMAFEYAWATEEAIAKMAKARIRNRRAIMFSRSDQRIEEDIASV